MISIISAIVTNIRGLHIKWQIDEACRGYFFHFYELAFIIIDISRNVGEILYILQLFHLYALLRMSTEKSWKKCKHPGQIRNGQVVVWGDGLLIEYICDKSFFAYGLTHGGCDPTTGKWTILPPVCVGKSVSRSHGEAINVFTASATFCLVSLSVIANSYDLHI